MNILHASPLKAGIVLALFIAYCARLRLCFLITFLNGRGKREAGIFYFVSLIVCGLFFFYVWFCFCARLRLCFWITFLNGRGKRRTESFIMLLCCMSEFLVLCFSLQGDAFNGRRVNAVVLCCEVWNFQLSFWILSLLPFLLFLMVWEPLFR